jgi:hypothetical protein
MDTDHDKIDDRTLALQQWAIHPATGEVRPDLSHCREEILEF